MVIACANSETADWVTNVVSNYEIGYRAWKSGEGPCANRIKVFVKNPTGLRDTKQIIDVMKRTDEIQGGYIILTSDQKEDGKFIRLSVDEMFFKRLEEIKFQPHCGLRKLFVEREDDLQAKKDSNKKTDLGTKTTTPKTPINNPIKLSTPRGKPQSVCLCCACKRV